MAVGEGSGTTSGDAAVPGRANEKSTPESKERGAEASGRLLVVANAPSENTRLLREAILDGARDEAVEGIAVTCREPLEAGPEDVLACDAIVLGTTANFGYMSGALKDFLERTYHPCLERTQGLPWALYIRGGSDGDGARDSVTRIVTGLRWKAVRPPTMLVGEWREEFVGQARELGLLMAASLEAGVI